MTDTVITSSQNAQLKLVRRLQRRRAREQERAFVVEGEDLVRAGIEAGAEPRVLLVDAQRPPALDGVQHAVLRVDPKLLATVSDMPHPPRVIGIFDLPETLELGPALAAPPSPGAPGPWIALDGVADPGNVGTVLRTAAAFRAAGVIALPGTADPWGPKASRASMGACFRLPIVQLDEAAGNVGAALDAARVATPTLRVVALAADSEVELRDVPLDGATLLVVGGERMGVGVVARSRADVVAAIPQDPAVESINAAVAASIALYEWSRRRPTELG